MAPFIGTGLSLADECGGVRVDSRLRCSFDAPGLGEFPVFAMGDVAAYPLASLGGPRHGRVEHVDCARKMASYVAQSILAELGLGAGPGSDSEFEYTPYLYMRAFTHAGAERPVSWQMHGMNDRGEQVRETSPGLGGVGEERDRGMLS